MKIWLLMLKLFQTLFKVKNLKAKALQTLRNNKLSKKKK